MRVLLATGLTPVLLSTFTGSLSVYSVLISLILAIILGNALDKYKVRGWMILKVSP